MVQKYFNNPSVFAEHYELMVFFVLIRATHAYFLLYTYCINYNSNYIVVLYFITFNISALCYNMLLLLYYNQFNTLFDYLNLFDCLKLNITYILLSSEKNDYILLGILCPI